MTATLRSFVRESNLIEGIRREPHPHEMKVHEKLLAFPAITVTVLEEFVQTIQPGAVLRREQGMDVRIGTYIPVLGGPLVETVLGEILDYANEITGNAGGESYSSHQIHLDYEKLHPFMDGNGRSGRALWLWMRGGIENAPLGFLHHFYYDTLDAAS